MLEEQRDEDIFFSENGERTNNEDGTNAAGKNRDYDTVLHGTRPVDESLTKT